MISAPNGSPSVFMPPILRTHVESESVSVLGLEGLRDFQTFPGAGPKDCLYILYCFDISLIAVSWPPCSFMAGPILPFKNCNHVCGFSPDSIAASTAFWSIDLAVFVACSYF